MHVWVAQIIQSKIQHSKTHILIRKPVTLNDAGIDALMLSQQTLLALALTAFVRDCARSRRAQWAIAILLVSNASLFVITNLISTEALAQVLVVAFVALGFRLFHADRLTPRGLGAYGLCLYVSIMTRHTNAIFAMLPPIAYLFRIAFVWIRERRTPPLLWKQMAIFVAAGFAGIVAANLTTRLICRAFDVPYRSISARATSERLGFVDRLPTQERESLLADLQKRAGDPVVKEAIPLLARSESWVHQRDEIQKILLRDAPKMDKTTLTLRSDAYLDRVASLFFRSRNHELVQETLDSMWRGLAATSAATVAEYYLGGRRILDRSLRLATGHEPQDARARRLQHRSKEPDRGICAKPMAEGVELGAPWGHSAGEFHRGAPIPGGENRQPPRTALRAGDRIYGRSGHVPDVRPRELHPALHLRGGSVRIPHPCHGRRPRHRCPLLG